MRTRDFLVGLTFFGLLTILAVSTIFFADFTFVPQYEMTVLFENAGGLFEGAEVRVDGLASGRVRGLERVRDRNVIRATLKFDEEPILYKGTTIEIVAASPLGGTVVEINSGDPTVVTVDGETGEKTTAPNLRWDPASEIDPITWESGVKVWVGPQATIGDAIASIKETASEIDTFVAELNRRKVPEKVDATVENIRNLTGALNQNGGALNLILGDTPAADVRNTIARLSYISDQIVQAGRVLDLIVGDDSAGDVRASLAQINAITKKISDANSGLAWLLGSEQAAADARVSLANIEGATSDIRKHTKRLAEAKSGLEWLLGSEASVGEVKEVVSTVKLAAEQIRDAAGRLNRNDNILGMLLTDAAAKKEVRNSIKSLSDFIETTRENAPITTFAGIILSPF